MSATSDHERDDVDQAAEYVLGVLDGAERRAMERSASRDPAVARAIDAWSRRLAPLTESVDPVEPPDGAWSRISDELDRLTRQPPARRSVSEPSRVSAIWRWIGLGSMGLAAASLAALVMMVGQQQWSPVSPSRTLTATLSSETGTPLVTVVIDTSTATATLIPVAGADEPGRVPELWLVTADGAAPRSLGLITMARPLRVSMTNGALDAAESTLAVSMEPEGGSPTGHPTGPVVASGPLQSI